MKGKLSCVLLITSVLLLIVGCRNEYKESEKILEKTVEVKSITNDQVAVAEPQDQIKEEKDQTVSENGLLPLPESGKKLEQALESEEGYSPEDINKLTDDYFTPESYNENSVDVYMYFSNTDRIYSSGFFPLEATGELLERTQTFLVDNDLEKTKEMKIVTGTESNSDGEVSFVFTLDAYPEKEIILFYSIENKTFEFGFLKKVE